VTTSTMNEDLHFLNQACRAIRGGALYLSQVVPNVNRNRGREFFRQQVRSRDCVLNSKIEFPHRQPGDMACAESPIQSNPFAAPIARRAIHLHGEQFDLRTSRPVPATRVALKKIGESRQGSS